MFSTRNAAQSILKGAFIFVGRIIYLIKCCRVMKRNGVYLSFVSAILIVLLSGCGQSSSPFITRWKAEAGEELRIPIVGKNYKIVIKKLDGTVLLAEASVTADTDKPYRYVPTEDCELLVEAGPEGVEYIQFRDNEDFRATAEKLYAVEKFGAVRWITMAKAFANCYNMEFGATVDTPDLSKVEDMSNMFSYCESFNHDISNWDVSHVMSMQGMFEGCVIFNQPLESWDVSQVIDMQKMFAACCSFNQALGSWNVSRVVDMEEMFSGCTSFNQNLGSWNLQNCRALGLQNSGISTENYATSLIGWAKQDNINESLVLEAKGNNSTGTAKEARTKLLKSKHWVINEDVSEGEKVYDLRVGGIQLTSENIASFQEALIDARILKQGNITVTTVDNRPVLKLDNAVLAAPSEDFVADLFRSDGDITIEVKGDCRMTWESNHGEIRTHGIIVGSSIEDKLNVGTYICFYGTIRNCTLDVKSSLFGALYYTSYSLKVDNAVVKALDITDIISLDLTNCSIIEPEGGYFDLVHEAVVNKDGEEYMNGVVIAPSN